MKPDRSPIRETSATIFALATATLMIAHQVAGKATRDALFLSNFDVAQLPKVVILAGLCSMLTILLMSKLLRTLGPARVMPLAFALSAILFVLEWQLSATRPGSASIVLYLHMATFGAVLISGFWSVVNERFDPHSAKRQIARIAAAAAMGGVLGGVLAGQLSSILDVRALLLVLAALHVLCALGVIGLTHHSTRAHKRNISSDVSAIQVLRKSRYLRLIASLAMLVSIVATLLDFAIKAEASTVYQSGEELAAFFGMLYAVVGLLTFLVQFSIGPRMLERYGLPKTMASLPVMVILCGIVATAFTHLWTVTLVRAAEFVTFNSLFRSAFEVLFTPVAANEKRPTKTIIDVGGVRIGDMLGSGLLLLLLRLVPEPPTSLVISAAMIVAGFSLVLVSRLDRGYVQQLAAGLRGGDFSLRADQIADATTRGVLMEPQSVSDRDLLLARIGALEDAGNRKQVNPEPQNQRASAPTDAEGLSAGSGIDDASASSTRQSLVAAIGDLESGDSERIRKVLRESSMEPCLVPFIVPHLADPALREDARMELRWMVTRIAGHLTDLLLDPDTPLEVRTRLPEVMEVWHSPRVIGALQDGLGDGNFDIRLACAQALSRMVSRSDELRVRRQVVFQAVARELQRGDARRPPKNPPARPVGVGFDAQFHYVFMLLGTLFEPEAVDLSRQALISGDLNQRGIALEYLENVLPPSIIEGLWKRLGIAHSTRPKKRSRKLVLEELMRLTRTR